MRQHFFNDSRRVVALIEGLVRLPACPHSDHLRSSRVFIYKFREVVDSFLEDHPQIVLVIVPTDFLPAVMLIFVFVVTLGLAMRVLFVVMTLMVILLSFLFVGLVDMLLCSLR